jgi:hypothetical protein
MSSSSTGDERRLVRPHSELDRSREATIGIFCIIGASTSQLFFFKSNPPSFSSFFVILCELSKLPFVLFLVRVALTSISRLTATYPLGNLMARYLPKRRVLGVNLNPGKFSIKG